MPKIMTLWAKEKRKEIREDFDGANLLTAKQIQQLLGHQSINSTKKWLEDVRAVEILSQKKYDISDIAIKLDRCRE